MNTAKVWSLFAKNERLMAEQEYELSIATLALSYGEKYTVPEGWNASRFHAAVKQFQSRHLG